jgi:hypothetical protein
VYITGERLIDLVKEFQRYIEKYGSTIRLEYKYDGHTYSGFEFYFEYKDLETDEEYQQRLHSKELAQKIVEEKEKETLKKLMEKYFPNV